MNLKNFNKEVPSVLSEEEVINVLGGKDVITKPDNESPNPEKSNKCDKCDKCLICF